MSTQRRREQVVFGGSSIGAAAIDPALLTSKTSKIATSYNYSEEGADAKTNERFITQIVLPRVRPDVVVMGLTPNELNDNGVRQRAGYQAMIASRGYRRAAGVPNWEDRVASVFEEHSALVRNRGFLRDPYRLFRWLRHHDDGTGAVAFDRGTGALLRHRERSYQAPQPAVVKIAQREVFGNFAVGGAELGAMKSMATTLRGAGTAFVIVELPSFREGFLNAYPGADDMFERTHRAIVGLADGHCIGRIDLRTELQDARFWSDISHPNGDGTKVITTAVAEWLDAHWAAITEDACL